MANLPLETYSVSRFCTTARELLESPDAEDTASFVKFVLTGVLNGQQAVIDPILNRVRDSETNTLQIRRDYDSVLGIEENILVSGENSGFLIYPLPKHEDSLTKNVHIQVKIQEANGDIQDIALHKIPNLCIAKWKVRNCIRILFVELCNNDRKYLSEDEKAEFYEKGLYPTVVGLLRDRASDWPPTYAAECFRARGHNGQYAFGAKVLPHWKIAEFAAQLRRNLARNKVTWATNFYFLHEFRGIKNDTYHQVEAQNCQVALETLFSQNCVNRADITPQNWVVDVGLEVSSTKGRSLAWRTDSHSHLVHKIARIQTQQANQKTNFNYKHYFRDPVSHLTGVSGFRLAPKGGSPAGEFDTTYINVYHTDKGITARQDQGHYGKFTTVPDILHNKSTKFINDLYDLYMAAADSSYSCARAEIRVSLEHAGEAMVDIEDIVWPDMLVSFSRDEWWSLRALRGLALKYTVEWQSDGDPRSRMQESALLLTAAVPWLLNGIHATPDTGPRSRELMNMILPHGYRRHVLSEHLAYKTSLQVDDDDSEDDEDQPLVVERRPSRRETPGFDNGEVVDDDDFERTIPHNPFGMVFLRTIRVGGDDPIPRIRDVRYRFSDRAFYHFFGMGRSDLELYFRRSMIATPRNPSRMPNRTRQRVIAAPPDNAGRNPFELASQGHSLIRRTRNQGSDIDTESESDSDSDDTEDIDGQMFLLWNQFCLDITAICPNRKSVILGPYCKLTAAERKSVTTETYRNRELSEYFDGVQWKPVGKDDWRKNFDRLFPKKGVKLSGTVQHYRTVAYYSMWQNMIEGPKARMSDKSYRASRKALWKLFRSLYWMPAACGDRIWDTRAAESFERPCQQSEREPAPKIFLNGGEQPGWST